MHCIRTCVKTAFLTAQGVSHWGLVDKEIFLIYSKKLNVVIPVVERNDDREADGKGAGLAPGQAEC